MARVLVAEPSAPISAALRRFLDGFAEVNVVHFVDEAVGACRSNPPEVLITTVSSTFDGEALAARVRQLSPWTGVILVYPPEETQATERAVEAAVDMYLLGPLKKAVVLAAVRAVLMLRELRSRVIGLEDELKLARAVSLQPPLPEARPVAATLNTVEESFFKKFMLLEVRRSKRYLYPVSLLLVELDRLQAFLAQEPSADFRRAAVRGEVLARVSTLVRDIDLALPFGEDKFLLFLPHTPRSGGSIVAQRVVERLRRLDSYPGGTASVGVAAFEPQAGVKQKISFGTLVREATAGLHQAQEAGGDRSASAVTAVEKPKRSRISMG